MTPKLWVLYKNILSSYLHKIRSNFATELTVLIGSIAPIGLLLYIARDFINEHLNEISLELGKKSLFYLPYVLLTGFSVFCGLWTRQSQKEPNWESFGLSLGESPHVIHRLRRMHFFTIAFFSYCLSYILSFLIEKEGFLKRFYLLPIFFLITWVFSRFPFVQRKTISHRTDFSRKNLFYLAFFKKKPQHLKKILLAWRLHFLLRQRLVTHIFSSFILIFAYVGSYFFYEPTKPIFYAFFCFISGMLCCIPISISFAEGLSYAWIEKNAGVVHEEYMKSIGYLCLLIGTSVAAINILFVLFKEISIQLLVIYSFISFTPAWCLQSHFFQIDPRKPFVHFVTNLLISSFICTGIFFLPWLALVLIPIYLYGVKSQKNRYYLLDL